jgi:hypothetical protein
LVLTGDNREDVKHDIQNAKNFKNPEKVWDWVYRELHNNLN